MQGIKVFYRAFGLSILLLECIDILLAQAAHSLSAASELLRCLRQFGLQHVRNIGPRIIGIDAVGERLHAIGLIHNGISSPTRSAIGFFFKEEAYNAILLHHHGGIGRAERRSLVAAVPVLSKGRRGGIVGRVVTELFVVDTHIAAPRAEGHRLEGQINRLFVGQALCRNNEQFAVAGIRKRRHTIVRSAREGLGLPTALASLHIAEGENVEVAAPRGATTDDDAAVWQFLHLRLVGPCGNGRTVSVAQHFPRLAKVVRINHIVHNGREVAIAGRQGAIHPIVTARLHIAALMHTPAANEHGLYGARGTMVEELINLLGGLDGLAPRFAAIMALEAHTASRIGARTLEESHAAGHTHEHHVVRLAVAHHGYIAKGRIVGARNALLYHKNVIPRFAVILRHTAAQVDARTAAHVGTARPIVGHGHDVAIASLGNGRNAIGNLRSGKSGKYVETGLDGSLGRTYFDEELAEMSKGIYARRARKGCLRFIDVVNGEIGSFVVGAGHSHVTCLYRNFFGGVVIAEFEAIFCDDEVARHAQRIGIGIAVIDAQFLVAVHVVHVVATHSELQLRIGLRRAPLRMVVALKVVEPRPVVKVHLQCLSGKRDGNRRTMVFASGPESQNPVAIVHDIGLIAFFIHIVSLHLGHIGRRSKHPER